jgi:hypothetical protein
MNFDSRFLRDLDLGKLNVFLAYENIAAALWASDLLTNLLRFDSDALAISYLPKSFEMLGSPSSDGGGDP